MFLLSFCCAGADLVFAGLPGIGSTGLDLSEAAKGVIIVPVVPAWIIIGCLNGVLPVADGAQGEGGVEDGGASTLRMGPVARSVPGVRLTCSALVNKLIVPLFEVYDGLEEPNFAGV